MEESEEITYYRKQIIRMIKKVKNLKILRHIYTVLRNT